MIHVSIEEQDEKQAYFLIRALLGTLKGQEFDGITAARYFSSIWGIYADWHIYSTILDDMTRNGLAKCTQAWGMTRFIIL